jgi:AraC-like DNA-binding protein
MVRATLRTFRDVRSGEVDLELAPAGMLLVIAFGDPYGVGLGDDSLLPAATGFAVGSQSRYGRSVLTGSAEGVQVDLPWSTAAAVFGAELADLADRSVGLPELSGGAELMDRLPETAVTDRPRLVAQWLRARTESHDRPSPLALRALLRIERGAPSVGALAAELGCSRGHLHRVVRSSTGQSPSTLVRVVRLHRLVAFAPTAHGNRSLADAATLLGYADHPHLCHETRLLAGRTPTQLLGRDIDAPTAETTRRPEDKPGRRSRA